GPGGRRTCPEEGGAGKHPHGGVHRHHDDQRRESRRVISHRQRADELEPPSLLVAAGEPADHEDAHKGDDNHPERADLEGYLPAESVETLRRTVERYGSSVVLGPRGGLIDRRLTREKVLRAHHREEDQESD